MQRTDCIQYGGIQSDSNDTSPNNNPTDGDTEPSTGDDPPLVGGNPCTWGPSYWCASLENAEKCGLKVG